MTWKMSSPPGMVASIASVSERKPPRPFSRLTSCRRCGSDRPRRSSFQTARTSFSPRLASASLSADRLQRRPRDSAVLEDAPTPRCFMRGAREGEVLLTGGDSGIADQHIAIVHRVCATIHPAGIRELEAGDERCAQRKQIRSEGKRLWIRQRELLTSRLARYLLRSSSMRRRRRGCRRADCLRR